MLTAIGEDEAVVSELSDQLDLLSKERKQTIDLTDFNWPKAKGLIRGSGARALQRKIIGYPASRAFFLKLSRIHGDRLVPEFLETTAQADEKERTNKRLISILDSLTAAPLKKEIKNFKLSEAIKILEQDRDHAIDRVLDKAVDDRVPQRERARAAAVLMRFEDDEQLFSQIKAILKARVSEEPVEFLERLSEREDSTKDRSPNS